MVEHSSNIVALCFESNTSQQYSQTLLQDAEHLQERPWWPAKVVGRGMNSHISSLRASLLGATVPSATRGLQRAVRGRSLGKTWAPSYSCQISIKGSREVGKILGQALLPWTSKETFSLILIHLTWNTNSLISSSDFPDELLNHLKVKQPLMKVAVTKYEFW